MSQVCERLNLFSNSKKKLPKNKIKFNKKNVEVDSKNVLEYTLINCYFSIIIEEKERSSL